MSTVSRSFTFTDNTDAYGSEVETEFGTIFDAWNNHDSGASAWTKVNISGSNTDPHTITGSGATVSVLINNTAADGDPYLGWQLGGTTNFALGIDDGDSDKLKLGLAAIGTNTILEFENASDAGMTMINDPTGSPVANTLYKSNIIKGWIAFTGGGTPAAMDSFNVSSIDDTATGDYGVNWDTDFADANYAVVASGEYANNATVDSTARTAAIAHIAAFDIGSGAKSDATEIHVMAISDQ